MKTFLCLTLLGFSLAAAPAALKPSELRCEHRRNPSGIDEARPRLSWTLAALDVKARGLRQSAYRIVAASNAADLKAGKFDLWDSGKVESAQSVLVRWAGKELTSGVPVYWKVQVWDQNGSESAWSEGAEYSLGLLKQDDWKGAWIGRDESDIYKHPTSPFQTLTGAQWLWYDEGEPATEAPAGERWFKATVTVPAGKTIRHATYVMDADNEFHLSINGEPAGRGSSVALPGVLDVSGLIKAGTNTIAVRTRNSRVKPAGLIGTLKIEFASGDPLVFKTGAGWEAAQAEAGPYKPAKQLGAYGMKPWGEVGYGEEKALMARLLRKEFTVAAGLKRAVLYGSGLGLSEYYVNGSKIGDEVLSPNLTEYEKRVFYVTHDVTKLVAPGKNAIGAMLGNGRYWAPRARQPVGMRGYGYPKLRLQLELEYANGKKETVVSDESWKLSTQGPVRVNNEYDGEEYDARMEQTGWTRAGFNEANWQSVQKVNGPEGELRAQMAEPLRVTETIKAQKITQVRPGVYIYDMGQNMVGWVRLKVNGPRGATVELRFAETLKPDGNLYLDNLRSARARDFYTLRGGAPESYEPRFTYHGFRFVEISGYPGTPTLASIEGRVVHDAMAKAGEFETSDALLNRIHRNIYWGIRGNYRSIPTDCPQRDERQGWLGDRSVVSLSESYMFDVAAFYTKFSTDMSDAQKVTGSIPDVVPTYWVLYNDGIVWPSTFILAPGMIERQYGDTQVVVRNYPAMKRWVEYMRTFLEDGIMPKNTYADWCVPPEKPELIHSQDPARITAPALISTAYYYQMLNLVSHYAELAGHAEDVKDYQALAATVKAAFLKKYFKPAENKFDNGTQTSSVLPLAFGMVPEENRKAVFDALVARIEKESDNHVGVGLVGAQWLMRALSDNGRADLAYTIVTQKTYPGWGYMVQKDATTIWELWNGDTADPAMNSANHVMQIGDLGVWMYEYLAGIRPDPEKPGFQHFVVKPYTVPQLSHVKATHNSPYGAIASQWKREAGKLTLNVTVPPNTSATIVVPLKNAAETGGLKASRVEGDTTVFEAGSGQYTFSAQ